MNKIRIRAIAAITLGVAISANANNIDGSIFGDTYGAALAVQSVETGFGDNLNELNAAYGQVKNGTLYLALTGNIEANFNRINIFIDSVSGGQGTLNAANPENDNWANNHNGFTFDAGFEADYMVIARRGGTQFDLDFSTVGGGLGSFIAASSIFGTALEGANDNIAGLNGIGAGYDNSNLAGVLAGSAAADEVAALAVTTGFEIAIPLTLLGNPSGDILVTAAIVNGDHTFYSNQFLGGLPAPQGNLGGDGAGNFTGDVGDINLNDFSGDQFFTVAIPEPGATLLMGLGALVFAIRRRVVRFFPGR